MQIRLCRRLSKAFHTTSTWRFHRPICPGQARGRRRMPCDVVQKVQTMVYEKDNCTMNGGHLLHQHRARLQLYALCNLVCYVCSTYEL